MQFYEDDKFDPPAPDSALSVAWQLLKYFIVIAIAIFVIYVIAEAGASRSSSEASSQVSADTPFRVEYRVKGSANDVDVSYENATGGQENRDQVFLPWSFAFQRKPGEFLYIAAYNRGGRGTLSCEILIDGVVQETQSIIGDGNVQCSGRWKR